MTPFWAPAAGAADPPASPPAPKPPRVMMALYVWATGRMVRELGSYLWDKGWRAGRAEGLRAGLAMGPATLPDWPNVEAHYTAGALHDQTPHKHGAFDLGWPHTHAGEQPGGSGE